MKRQRLIVHLLAVAGGYLAAALLAGHADGQKKVTAEDAHSAAVGLTKYRERGPDPGPREMLEEMMHLPMDPGQRLSLKSSLNYDWAVADPLGFLESLEGRAWPENSSYHDADGTAYAELARRNPKQLIQYARKTGNKDAWRTLMTQGHPNQILSLLLAEPSRIPRGVLNNLFGDAMDMDSSFHQHVAEVGDPERREEAFKGASEALLDASRFGEFFAWVEELGESIPAEVIGQAFGREAEHEPGIAKEIGRLPEEARLPATDTILDMLGEGAGDSERMQILRDLNEAGWWGQDTSDPGWVAKIEAAIDIDYSGLSDDAWKDWALKLSDDGPSRVLKETAIRRWIADSPLEMMEAASQIEQLPDVRLRDLAYAQLVDGLMLSSDDDGWRAPIDRIEDDQLREVTYRRALEKRERLEAGSSGE